MSSVPNRLNVKLARLFYKYDEPREKPVWKEETPFVPPEDYEAYAPYNFSWFIEGKIAAMGCPRNDANLNYLVDAGVHHLLTLSPERRPPIETFNAKRKLRWSEIRIKEFGAPTLKQILKFIEVCERAEIRGETVGVHCRHGRGRTGTMLACYLVHFKDMAPERAVMTVRVQRPGSCETFEQEKVVCHYHDCLRGTIPRPDYRLLEDKDYFDMEMSSTYGEKKKDDEEEIQESSLSDDEKEKAILKLRRKKKKTHAMVINHHIYF